MTGLAKTAGIPKTAVLHGAVPGLSPAHRSPARRSLAGLSLGLIASVALMESAIAPATAQTLPTGPSVAAGAVSIATPSGTSVIIDQTSRNAVINWNSFSIGTGNSVSINNGGGATLNRVTGNIPSRIDGSLTATGSVYLVNPAGVAVGPGGKVLTGGSFTASTLDVPDAAFLNGGDKSFSGTSKATVTNAGSIGSLGGDVALIAREVANSGTITAPNGTVGLAAGYEVLVKDGAVEGGKFQVKVGGADTAAGTSGRIAAAAAEIRANGGNVYALAGNTGGVIAATGTASTGGRIFLTAGDGGTVEAGGTIAAARSGETGAVEGGDIRISGGKATVTGTLSARGTEGTGTRGNGAGRRNTAGKGGTVAVTGTAVTLTGTATVDVSGSRGGAIVVGGDYQGGRDAARKTLKEPVANARTTTVAAGARLTADATSGNGDGGSVVAWSDERTVFLGTITARGAGAGGNGGSAEVSGKAALSFHGTADLTAASGRTGTLLLDPYNLTISAGSDSTVSGLSASGNDSVLGVSTLTAALASANVTVSTGAGGSQAGTITVAAPVSWSADTVLTLAADGDIAVNAALTATGAAAGLILQYGAGKGYSIGSAGSVTLEGANATLRIGEAGALDSYTLIRDMAALDAIETTGLSGRYALARSLDATGTTYTAAPVSGTFTGTFAGLGNSVSNLTVSAPATDYVGLFGTLGSGSLLRDFGVVNPAVTGKTRVGAVAGATVGTVTNAYATGGSVTGTERVGGLIGSAAAVSVITQSRATSSVSGAKGVGGLVGWSQGTVAQSHATGGITGTDERIGGLLGYHAGTVSGSYATGAVSGALHVGGLSGWNQGTVTQSHATGSVTGTGESVGGLVGWNASTITGSYATGSVTGDTKVGGLVGDTYLTTTITESYATGAVSGNTDIGGLVGWHQSGTVTQSHATGSVTGTDNVGGLAGFNSATVTESHATGTVSGSRYIGGLVGWNQETITRSNATGAVSGTGEAIGGLVGHTSITVSQSYATGTVSGSGVNLGGLAGSNYGTVTQSYATGNVSGSGDNVGGLLGVNGDGTVTQSHATGEVTGRSTVGGFAGSNSGTITQSYATGGGVSGNASIGGFIGSNSGSISQSYAVKAVSGSSSVGGFFGLHTGGTVTSSYFDTTVAGTARADGVQSTVTGSTGLTTAQFQNTATFMTGATGWDFDGVWAPPSSGHYPVLYSMAPVAWVKAASTTSVYGDATGTVGTVTVQGNPGTYVFGKTGDSLPLIGGTISVDATAGVSATPAATGLTAANTTVTSAKGTGYRVFYYGSLAQTVTPAALTVTAGPVRKTYGDAIALSGFAATGLKNGDSVSGLTLDSAGTAATAGVGNYTIAASSAQGSRLSNYTITYAGGTLTVDPAALTISAGPVRKTYGDTTTPGGFTAAGLKNGDSVTGVTLASTGTAATAGVGTYAIATSNAVGSGLANYTVTYLDGSLTVDPAALTVTAGPARKTYGDAITLSGFTAAGLKNGDSVSGVTLTSTGTAATAGVGDHAVTASSARGSGLSNYTIGYAEGALTVTSRPILVTADTLSRPAGTANPTLTYKVGGQGLVNGDTLSGFLSTAASAASPAGSYAIDRGTLAASPNYSLAFQSGVLTVIAAGETERPPPPVPESRTPSEPVRVEELTQILANAVLPRNLVMATASQAMQPFQGNGTPVSFPSAGSQVASGSAGAATGTSGESSGSGSQGSAGDAAACVGGAAASSACTTAPHPENTRFGRFLRFPMP